VSEIQIKKRNGEFEKFDAEKINKVIQWACEDIKDVNPSDVAMNAKFSIENKTSSSSIQEILIRSANDMISLDTPNYQYVAGRLRVYALRKEVWGTNEPPRLYDHLRKHRSLYDDSLLSSYSESEIHKIGKMVKHDRDFSFAYAGIQQMCDKYLIKDRSTGQIYETPQFAFVLVPMVLFKNYPNRLDMIKKTYDYISQFKINLPTPILAGVRTKLKNYSSCVLISIDDTLNSIFSSCHIVGQYVADRSGIGLDMGAIRAANSPIRNGEVRHTGIRPFAKLLESSVNSTSQGGIRKGSATVNFPFFHPEIQEILTYKNNKGADEKKVRFMDYCIQISGLLYDRLQQKKNITLMSYHEHPEVYKAFGLPTFNAIYEAAEKKGGKFSKTISAVELMDQLAKERLETGRIYTMHIDHANSHGTFKERVTTSNLCVAPETQLLTKNGYVDISSVVDSLQFVWNGKEWSGAIVKKTGEDQKLVTVSLSNGMNLDCTLYHKWYTVDNYRDQAVGKTVEKRTHELKVGDRLCKFDLPVVDGNEEFKYPYTHGLFCADGTYEKNGSRISLYGEKKKLVDFLDIKTNRGEDSSGRINVVLYDDIGRKFSTPINSSIETKMLWLAGLMDGDGTVCINGDNQSLQIKSVEKNFLREVQLLLQTVGVESKIATLHESGEYLMPDGKGGYKIYNCRSAYRLTISSVGLFQLSSLGFKTNRLVFSERLPQRNASQFVTIESINDNGRYDDTYCVNELNRHMAVFNGILTGNCQEITHPIVPVQSLDDANGLIGICVLSAVNLLTTKDDEFEDVCYIICRILHEVIDQQEYRFPAAERFCKGYRSIGVGVSNYAAYLASKKIKMNEEVAVQETADIFEKLSYYMISASCKIAEETGTTFPYYDKTKWSDGILPCDTAVPLSFLSDKPKLDWEALRARVKQYGMVNGTVLAQMPVESSSVPHNSTNGIDNIREFLTTKKSGSGNIKMLPPNWPKNKSYYVTAFEMSDQLQHLRLYAAMQRYICMSISANLYMDYANYPDGKIPRSEIVKQMMYAHRVGVKNLYYLVTPDGSDDQTMEESGCSGGACAI
jgi:ribonucleoside-diphosphate reductase alpha chain